MQQLLNSQTHRHLGHRLTPLYHHFPHPLNSLSHGTKVSKGMTWETMRQFFGPGGHHQGKRQEAQERVIRLRLDFAMYLLDLKEQAWSSSTICPLAIVWY